MNRSIPRDFQPVTRNNASSNRSRQFIWDGRPQFYQDFDRLFRSKLQAKGLGYFAEGDAAKKRLKEPILRLSRVTIDDDDTEEQKEQKKMIQRQNSYTEEKKYSNELSQYYDNLVQVHKDAEKVIACIRELCDNKLNTKFDNITRRSRT